MSGYCLFWIIVWTCWSKFVHGIVVTFTLMSECAASKAETMVSQYLALVLLGPVP